MGDFLNNIIQFKNNITLPAHAAVVTKEYFIANFQEFLPRYISNGNPSKDTFNTYLQSIKQFIRWCTINNYQPLEMQDYEMRIYLDWLYSKNYKKATISIKIVSIRAFFHIAQKLKFCEENPLDDISPRITPEYTYTQAFSMEQMEMLLNSFQDEKDLFIKYRDMSILALMGFVGLRRVEVYRMNRENINWQDAVITIRGKTNIAPVFPPKLVMALLRKYIDNISVEIDKEGAFTPLFLTASKNRKGKRLSRRGISFVTDEALRRINLKRPGMSCHIFRHTFGTNLYKNTKDLRLVQEHLRHRDPKTTARYTHVLDNINERYSENVTPKNIKF